MSQANSFHSPFEKQRRKNPRARETGACAYNQSGIISGDLFRINLAFVARIPGLRVAMELSNSSGKNSKRQSYLGREKKYFHERIRWIELELVISFRFEYLIPSLWDGLLHYSQALSGNASVIQIMSNARIASGFVQKKFFYFTKLLPTKVKRVRIISNEYLSIAATQSK